MIRVAVENDLPRVAVIVRAAYAPHAMRMDRLPGPMLDDYRARITAGSLFLLEDRRTAVGLIVLLERPDHLLLDNVAVDPAFQGQGHGRALIAFAEAETRRRGLPELRLYTHESMVENIALYARLGFEETHRALQDGYQRVFMRKRLRPEALAAVPRSDP